MKHFGQPVSAQTHNSFMEKKKASSWPNVISTNQTYAPHALEGMDSLQYSVIFQERGVD